MACAVLAPNYYVENRVLVVIDDECGCELEYDLSPHQDPAEVAEWLARKLRESHE